MAYRQQVRSGAAADAPEQQEDGADLRDEKLSGDVDAMLGEIDCCLKDQADEQEAAEARERDAAQREYKAVMDACDVACGDYSGTVCRHSGEMQAWYAQHGEKFFWCCGEPVFDAGTDALMAEAGAVRGLR